MPPATLSADVLNAIGSLMPSTIDTMVSDAISSSISRSRLQPESIDYDDVAVSDSARQAIAALSPADQRTALDAIARAEPMLLRVSRPGDGSALPISELGFDERKYPALLELRGFSIARGAENTFGSPSLGIDGRAVADKGSGGGVKKTIGDAVRDFICKQLRPWFDQRIGEIKERVQKDGLWAAMKFYAEKFKEIVTGAITALVAAGMAQWVAVLLIGLVVAILAAAIYWIVTEGLPRYCPVSN